MIPRFTIDAERRLVHFIYGDSVMVQEWRVAMREATLHPEFQPGFGFIMEGRGVNHAGSSQDMKSAFAYLRDNEIAFGRLAAVVPDLASFAAVRSAQSVSSDLLHQRMRIVWTLNEAFAWVTEGREPG